MPAIQRLVVPLPRMLRLATKSSAADAELLSVAGLSALSKALESLPHDVQAKTSLVFDAELSSDAAVGLKYRHDLVHIDDDGLPWLELAPAVSLIQHWLKTTAYADCYVRSSVDNCFRVDHDLSNGASDDMPVLIPSGLLPEMSALPSLRETELAIPVPSLLDGDAAAVQLTAALAQLKSGRYVALYLDLDFSTLLPLQSVLLSARAGKPVTVINPAVIRFVHDLALAAKAMDALPLLSIQFITARELPAGCSQSKMNEAVSRLLVGGSSRHSELFKGSRSTLSVLRQALSLLPTWLHSRIKQSCPHIGSMPSDLRCVRKRDFVDEYFDGDVVGKTRASVLNVLLDDSAAEAKAFSAAQTTEQSDRGLSFAAVPVLSNGSVDDVTCKQLQLYSTGVRRQVAMSALRRHSFCVTETKSATTVPFSKPRSMSLSSVK